MLNFGLELAGRPAGIAEGEDGACRSIATRYRLENIERRGKRDPFIDRQRRILDEKIAGVQHEAAFGFNRTAHEHLDRAGARRQFDQIGGRQHLELHEQVGKVDIGRRLIDDDAHRAFGRMRAHIDHGARETLVLHGRRRDQHLTIQIAARSSLIECLAGRSHNPKTTPKRHAWETSNFTFTANSMANWNVGA